ncbi:hypothetical protein RCG23_00380 [Neobacillus sp. PS3-34]|uniref:hypothetical protein n=1 Tax=Neobacillus sp. PS3-34 TaxID=3070678 RepID=UPI0027E0B07D|nr:hypothetical protein [Neobacillus sp. PS3-34]WML48649.1 hypothetical protein RCG23_00380 [Neobacillus sp. PS3-34]
MENSSTDTSKEKNIHQTVNNPQSLNSLEQDSAPFNDVIKHIDIVNGFQSPKKLEQIPKWFQNPVKVISTIFILVLISTLLYQFIQIIISIITDK